MEYADLVGRRIGHLVVAEFLRKERYQRRFAYIYRCRCDCGKEVELPRSNLVTSHTQSCGCYRVPKGESSPFWTGHGEISGFDWGRIKMKAEERDLPFCISIEDAWEQYERQKRRCALTGLSLQMRKTETEEKTASLDRIDSLRGYEKDNIQWVHKDINRIKGMLPPKRFVELCQMVARHQGGVI